MYETLLTINTCSELYNESIAKIFANHGDLNVQFNHGVENATIKVYSVDGRQVINADVSSGNFVSKMNNGMYLVNITSEGRTQTAKVIVF